MYGRSLKLFSMITIIVAALAVSLSAQTCETDNWDSKFFRPGQVSALKVAAAGGKVYVAGTFTETYDMGGGSRSTRQVTGIMTWDGSQWHFPSWEQGLNAGGGSWTFSAIMPFGTDVIVAGDFTQTNGGDMTIKYIARWDGTQWWPLGDGVNNTVYSLATTGNFDVYAGGAFTRIGADTAHYVAKWTSGGGWTPLFDPSETQQGTNGIVRSLAIYNNRVVMGGAFTSVGSGIPANHLAEWNWTTNGWDQFAGGTDESVERLAVGVGGLYASEVDTAGTVPITGVAHWDGAAWHDLETPSFSGVMDIDTWNSGDLIACGSYLDNPPDQANRTFAHYNSGTSQWEDFLSNCNLEATGVDIAVDGLDIYAVITFGFGATYACGSSTGSLVHFDGTEWRGFGEGMTENGAWGTALSISDTAVYVGGILGWLGGVGMHNGVGQWSMTDQRWHSFTMEGISGLKYYTYDATVWDVEEINGDVYSVGQFTNAGSISANSIVGWDGSAFYNMGGVDLSSVVYAVEPFQGDVYFGGLFYNTVQPGGSQQSLGGFVRWNGVAYERPDSTNLNSVFDMEDAGDYIYLGGQWGTGYLIPTANIVRYDGTHVDSVGGGVSGRVYDVDVSGADVYVAGGFQTATNPDGSTVNAHRLARWNGITWEALGDFNDTVRAVYVRGSEIYAGGHFTMVDGVPANHIAWYDGTQWKALGEGTEGEYIYTNGVVYELDSDGDALWVVGRFAFANTLPSQNIARWTFCTPAPPPVAQGGGSVVNGTSVTLNWGGGGLSAAATTYDLQVATGADFSNIVLDSSGISATSLQVTGLLENTAYSWRVRSIVDAEVGAWSARNAFTTGVAGGCCVGMRGNTNGDPEDKVNVTDIVYLVEHLFGVPSGPAPVCVQEGNANGDPEEKNNITDITYLVQYLFGVPNGPAPPNCP